MELQTSFHLEMITFAPAPTLLWSWLPGHKHTPVNLQGLCWSSHLPEQPAWPTSAVAKSCIQGKPAGAEHWAHAMPCHEEVRGCLLLYVSFQLQLLWEQERSVCCLVPRAAPSPGPWEHSDSPGKVVAPSRAAWRSSLEERSLHVPRIKVGPILLHFSQTFQNRKGQHFVIVNDVLSFSVLKVAGSQRRELKTVITEHALTLSSIYLGCGKTHVLHVSNRDYFQSNQ